MVLNPVTTQHEQLGLDNTGEQTLSETTSANDKNMPAEPLSDATADNNPGMQTNNEQILQISLRQDEVDQLNKLFADAMEDPVIESPKTEGNPRDGLHSSLSKQTLPKLGPGDIEVTVVASTESDTAAKEIVDNKTIRIDGEGQSSGIPDDHKICRGCTAVGHILESCPKDHGLKFTHCQMHLMGQTNVSGNKMKPAGTGIDQFA